MKVRDRMCFVLAATTIIRGYVEGLLEKTINDPKQTERFLRIIAKHSDRLNAIIENLLILSRLEEGEEGREIFFEKAKLKPMLVAAVELSSIKAEDKQMKIQLVCDEHIEVRMNAALLEQAVLSLVDNAIKYSTMGNDVIISIEQNDKEVNLTVQDNGCGIAPEHLPHIFERFYCLNKGRSRKLGGIGLGLVIVKHIAQVHGGYVTAESTLGQGSTFTIHLPA